jgi:choline-glycine betaine transporter
MITSLSQAAQLLPMIAQEGGAEPGEGLTALQTFTYFVAAPIATFIIISVIAWFASAPKREKKDVVNRIDDDIDEATFLTMIA